MITQEELQLKIHNLEKQIAELHAQIKKQSYGLTWIDVPEAFDEDSKDKIPILEEVKERAIYANCDDSQTKPHIIIEGDNYHALTCLNYTHKGKVDLIYIDPPYNTGNDGFTYKDKFRQNEYPDGVKATDPYFKRHTYWLSFMSKRLELAQNLLSDKGVIFVSIDDNEQANLKLLCDKIFGEENFVAEMIWQQGKKHIGSFIGINHEYMLVFAKSKAYINDNQNKWRQKKDGLDKIYSEYNRLRRQYKNDNQSIEDGIKTFFNSLPESDAAYNSKHYCRVDNRGLFFADNISQGTGNGPRYDVLHPITHKPVTLPAGGWRYAQNTMNKLLAEDRIFFGEDETKVPCRKRYLSETEYELPSSVFYRDGRGASLELDQLFGKKVFNNPKDKNEIARILNFRDNAVILDFFAGSGTTMHATMKLNAEDGGTRQCILVQQNEGENHICEDITYERNKRVMCGYTNAKGEAVAGLGGSMKYYKTAFVGKNRPQNATDTDCVILSQKAGGLLALGENTLEELKHNNSYQIFSDNGKRFTAIYFTGNLDAFGDFVSEIEQIQQDKQAKIAVYIFCWGCVDSFENEFNNMKGISLKAIPQSILEIYKSINS